MQTVKLFKNGRSQAVRLPAEFRFEGDEVLIRRDPVTGDVILSPRNRKFEEWLKLRDKLLPLIPREDLDALDNSRDLGPRGRAGLTVNGIENERPAPCSMS